MQQTDRVTAPAAHTTQVSPGISVVLPAYNEAAIIQQTVLPALTDQYELIVVDDGSRDDTQAVLLTLADAQPGLLLRMVRNQQNQGYGAALASCFDAATRELVFMTDADGQFDVAELERFLLPLDPATDMVIGWRERRADPRCGC